VSENPSTSLRTSAEVRIGVFICECGEEIAPILDLETLERQSHDLPGVVFARRMLYSCSPDGQQTIRQAIAEQRLDRVVVAGCPAKLMRPLFRQALDEADIAPHLIEVVDIREGCAYVHSDEPRAATIKALDIIAMGVARVALSEPVEVVTAEVTRAALVVGGGVAGMTTALALANGGVPTVLVEREAELGGLVRQLHAVFPRQASGPEVVADLALSVLNHPKITVRLECAVSAVSGQPGCYNIALTSSNGEGAVAAPQRLDVGVVVVATGARPLFPSGRFGYDRRRVITQFELEQRLALWNRSSDTAASIRTPYSTGLSTPLNLPSGGESASNAPDGHVVMLLCAGQRDERIPYCSGVCCMTAMRQAQAIRAAHPEGSVTILYRDLLPYGESGEEAISLTRQQGVCFTHYTPDHPPRLTDEGLVLPDGQVVPCDLLVLATPLVAQEDASTVAALFHIPQDANGFFADDRVRLRPGEYIDRGVYVAGAVHFPTHVGEATFQGYSVAARALRFINQGTASSHKAVAWVDEELCTGCGACAETCPYDAIAFQKRDGLLYASHIDPLLCKGCGNCVVACPPKAIRLPDATDAQLLAQIEAALRSHNGSENEDEPRILGFCCEWSAYAAAELAGAERRPYPSCVRLIPVGCSARFDPYHVLWAFLNGADGVFLGGCKRGECHYVTGNKFAFDRIAALRTMLTEHGFDRQRLRLAWYAADDGAAFARRVNEIVEEIELLGPSPIR